MLSRLLWRVRNVYRRRFSRHLFDIVVRGPDGRVLAVMWAVPNRLANEGEILDLRAIYRNEAVFGASFFFRLYNVTPTDSSTLASIAASEMFGNGYAPVAWNRNTTDWAMPTTLPSGEGETVGVIKGWTATGGNIGPFTHIVMATSSDNSGYLYAYASLGGAQTIINGTTWEIRPRGRVRGVSS